MFARKRANQETVAFSVERRAGDVDGCVRLVLHGELDIASQDMLTAALDAEVRAGNGVIVVLDHLAYLDSAGMSALLVGRARSLRAGLHFAVTPGMGNVRHVLDITGVLEQLCGAGIDGV